MLRGASKSLQQLFLVELEVLGEQSGLLFGQRAFSSGCLNQTLIKRNGLHQHSLLMPFLQNISKPGTSSRFFNLTKRFCSKETPKRGFENFFPKGKKPSQNSTGSENNKKDPNNDPRQQLLMWATAGGAMMLWYLFGPANGGVGGMPVSEVSFQEFKTRLLAEGLVARIEVTNGQIAKVYLKGDNMVGVDPGSGQLRHYFRIGSVDSFERKMDEAQASLGISSDSYLPVTYTSEVSLLSSLFELAPTLMLIGFTYWLVSRQMRGMGGAGRFGPGKFGPGGKKGGDFFGMGRANVGAADAEKAKTTFADVAGCDEAKQEIMEFVDFLKNPKKYQNLGAKIPKGALLVGPPGTGKTLLAKATAGEASVPFLSISGSDFMEMFVGVGPARVRDLFAQARAQSPSIIFIDEIDAIGRARGKNGAMGGHDERENTLNQLLVEMDGFATTTGVVVLAGTNRADVLDKALLRPGRFDRTITVDMPDIKGREQIYKVHLAKLALAQPLETYVSKLAGLTPGMSGADIANVCNEAALLAARTNKDSVAMSDFQGAIDRVIGGLEKKHKVISKEERRTVAYHESGHAVVSWFLQYAEPLLKVSIVPRGSSVLGFAQYLPNENVLYTQEQLVDSICATLAGRAAEQVMLGKISTGAVNDLEKVTQIAYAQTAVYGMNERIGLLSYRMDRDQLDKPYSEQTAHMIDVEVRAFVDQAYKRTLTIIEEKKHLIEAMAESLLEKEVLVLDDIELLLGKRPFASAEMRNIDYFRGTSAIPAPPSPIPIGTETTVQPLPAGESSSSPPPETGGSSPPEDGPETPPSGGDNDGKSGVKTKKAPGVVVVAT